MEQLLGYSLNKRAQGSLSVAPGIAEFIPMRDTSLADVLNRADNAMYINKHYIKTQK